MIGKEELLDGKVPFSRRLGLDGMRGIFAILVVFFHLKIPFFIQGYAGVDGFFVLSGFVITSIIVRELFHKKDLDYFKFYARRSKRLLPASLAVILISCMAYRFVVSDYLIERNRGSFIAGSAFYENFYLIANAKDYFGTNTEESPLMHYWSLAVEEQFYLFYPAILCGVLKYLDYDIKKTISLMCTSIGGLLIYQFFCTEGFYESDIYFGTLYRIYQLLSGAVIGLVLFQFRLEQKDGKTSSLLPPPYTKLVGSVLSSIGLFGTILLATPLYRDNSSMIGLLSTIGTIMLIVGLECNEDSLINFILCHPGIQFLGKHSYAIYLWHYPFIIISQLLELRHSQGQFASEIEVLVIIIFVSYATWYCIELPMKNLKVSDRKVVLGALLAVVLTFIAVSIITALPEEDDEDFVNPLLHGPIDPAVVPPNTSM